MILVTTDGGANWRAQTSGTPITLTAVTMLADGQRGWAVGRGTILATTDGGANWRAQTSGTNNDLTAVTMLADGQRGWAVGFGATILATTDGGASWTQNIKYRRLPAPWVFVVWVFSAGFAGAGARRLPRQPPWPPDPASNDNQDNIAEQLASDRPWQKGDYDALGYGRTARNIASFLSNPKTEPPLNIAISGKWGTGKSSIMGQLEEELKTRDFHCLWFNAWHHQKEQHLFAALIEAVRTQAVPSLRQWRGWKFRARLAWGRIGSSWPVYVSALFLFAVATSVLAFVLQWGTFDIVVIDFILANIDSAWAKALTPLKIDLPLPIIKGVLGATLWGGGGLMLLLQPFMTKLKSSAKLMAGLSGKFSVKRFAEQLSFRHHFGAAFKEVCEAIPGHLVLIVDDLDRCKPGYVVEVLEAINFLTVSGKCFIVLGIAKDTVEKAIGLDFKEMAAEMAKSNRISDKSEKEALEKKNRQRYARNYLEKLINIEVRVPPLTKATIKALIAGTKTTAAEKPSRPAPALAWAIDIWSKKRPELIESGAFGFICVAGLWLFLSQPSPSVVHEQPIAPAQQSADNPQRAATPAAQGLPAPAAPAQTAQPQSIPPTTVIAPSIDTTGRDITLGISAVLLLGLIGALLFQAWRDDERDDAEKRVPTDSKDFKDALNIWSPVVLRQLRSPRKLKRFINLVRFYAMGQRDERNSVRAYISDEKLVLMAAVDNQDSTMIKPYALGDFFYKEYYDVTENSTEAAQGFKFSNKLKTACDAHIERFGKFSIEEWEVALFHGITGSARSATSKPKR